MDAVEVQPHVTELDQQTVDRFYSAYATFLQALQPAWLAPEVQQDGANAYQAYIQLLQELMDLDLRKRMTEAWNAYVAFVEKTLSAEDIQASTREAYQDYLQSVRQIWLETDVERINAPTLAAINQSLGMASWLAAASTGVAGMLSDGSPQATSPG